MTDQSNNVIRFPGVKRSSPEEPSPEEVISNLLSIKNNHINQALTLILPILFNNIEIAGFPLGEDEQSEDINMKDGVLIIEAIRSLLCKTYGIYHPFQDIAENLIEKGSEDDYIIKKSINVEFKQPMETL